MLNLVKLKLIINEALSDCHSVVTREKKMPFLSSVVDSEYLMCVDIISNVRVRVRVYTNI